MDPKGTFAVLFLILVNTIFAIPVHDYAGRRRPMPGNIGNMQPSRRAEASSFLPVPTELPQADCSSPTTPFMVFGHSCSAPTDCDIDGVKTRISEAKMRIAMIDVSSKQIRLPGTELGFNRTVLDCTMRHDRARLDIMQNRGLAWCARDTWFDQHPECSDKMLDAYFPHPVITDKLPYPNEAGYDKRCAIPEARVDPRTFHGEDPDVAAGNAFAAQAEHGNEDHAVKARPHIRTATTTHEWAYCGTSGTPPALPPHYPWPSVMGTGEGPPPKPESSRSQPHTRAPTRATTNRPLRCGMTAIPSHLLPHHPNPSTASTGTPTQTSPSRTQSTTRSPTRPYIHRLQPCATKPHSKSSNSHTLVPRQNLRDFTGSVTPSGYEVLPITYEGKTYDTFCEICSLRYGDRVTRGSALGGELFFAEEDSYPWPDKTECKTGCERDCNVLGICTGGPYYPFPTDPALREKMGKPPL